MAHQRLTEEAAKMLCHVTRPDSVVMEVEVDAKANGEDCLNKVGCGWNIHHALFFRNLFLYIYIYHGQTGQQCSGCLAKLSIPLLFNLKRLVAQLCSHERE